ncbi:granulin [Trichonephila inaurata madagascariensis]|uniref:Granulin n=1 Tax=Trichonephila inaurata madagascariensis TaxID=2747483 RepID=A0A8X7CL64_9ARAC|nr:granulin [Trichonephila inaurata madagascariensis]
MNFLLSLALLSSVVGVFSDCEIGFCKPHETCCPAEDPEGWRCCPFIESVCCADKIHCCPKHSVCDLESGVCFPEETPSQEEEAPSQVEEVSSQDLEKRVGAFEESESDLAEEAEFDVDATRRCDKGSYCPDESTCCEVLHGGYGCCPLPNAVCCPDKIHCCYSGEHCDASSHYCIRKRPITRAPAELIEGNETS